MATLTLPIRPHVHQEPLIMPDTRFNVIAGGRRWGKTEAEKLNTIYRVMQGMNVWWLNPTFDNTTETWNELVAFFEQLVPKEDINRSRREIKYKGTGGRVRMIGANNFKRGTGIDHVTIDEAAFCDLENLWGYQIRPMLLESQGSATFLSSTNGRNYFWQLYQRGLDPDEQDWKSWHFTSYDNPLLSHDEIDDIRLHTPERVFNQEYMAEFLADGGAVFRNLQACIQPPPTETGRIVFGVDWGRSNDFTVIVAIDADTGHMLAMDRFNQIDWTMQRNRLKVMYDRYQPDYVLAEANSIGSPNIEELRKLGLNVRGFTTTAKSKQEIINSLALALEQGTIGILDDPVLIAELQAYSIERLPSGNFRYNAPAGMHDDCVIALALAWRLVMRSSITIQRI
jgi:phage FluMu gp28-like protein